MPHANPASGIHRSTILPKLPNAQVEPASGAANRVEGANDSKGDDGSTAATEATDDAKADAKA